jgi:hypothetical protein
MTPEYLPSAAEASPPCPSSRSSTSRSSMRTVICVPTPEPAANLTTSRAFPALVGALRGEAVMEVISGGLSAKPAADVCALTTRSTGRSYLVASVEMNSAPAAANAISLHVVDLVGLIFFVSSEGE